MNAPPEQLSMNAPPEHHAGRRRRICVCIWLACIGLLVYATILIGGATRLTDSGLSITEWRPLSGALPPLSDQDWRQAFALYRQTGEYKIQNPAMSLDEFKYIYWWEWGHRQSGRLIGVVFIIPFLLFWRLGAFSASLFRGLLLLFGMGALQAAAGWWMVVSGLGDDRTDVAAYRLMFHFGLALLIIGWCFWLMLTLMRRRTRFRRVIYAPLLTALVFAQMLSGALTAGLDGGLVHNDWPLMSGRLIAADIFSGGSLTENPALAQFMHRILAYVLLVMTLSMVIHRPERTEIAFLILVSLQAALGIYTLLQATPLSFALMHQGLGVIVFLVSVLLTNKHVSS